MLKWGAASCAPTNLGIALTVGHSVAMEGLTPEGVRYRCRPRDYREWTGLLASAVVRFLGMPLGWQSWHLTK